jgi:hypothetical protein
MFYVRQQVRRNTGDCIFSMVEKCDGDLEHLYLYGTEVSRQLKDLMFLSDTHYACIWEI